MAALDPKFNGWAMSNAGLVVNRGSMQLSYPTREQKSVEADWGVTHEVTLAGRKIKLSGTIAAATNTLALTNWSTLLKRTRGAGDRVKKGQLDIYDNGHWYAQAVGAWGFDIIPGEGKARVTMDFFADDPFRRDGLKILTDTPTPTDPTFTVTLTTDFSGDAPRIPMVWNLGVGWQKDELVRVLNTTTNEYFEHVVSRNLGVSESLVIDGEVYEVLEGDTVAMEGTSGAFPYLRGGITNQFDFTDTDRLSIQYATTFWDRFF